MKIISLFSGCGGLDLGFERAGFDITIANEYDSTIWETFKINHPKTMLIQGDIRTVDEGKFPSNIQWNNRRSAMPELVRSRIVKRHK